MSTELITTNSLTIAEKLQFKDERLSAATQEIINIYGDAMAYADAKNRQLASILSRVKNEKSYTEDGFSSVADYASKTFGFQKGKAYQLAAAGDIYNDEQASERLKAFSPSKLAEIANVPRETLEADVESGKITPDTTQKALREYKALNTASDDKETLYILDLYEARPICSGLTLPEAFVNLFKAEIMTISDWDTKISEYINSNSRFECEVIKLSKAPALVNGSLTKKRTVERRLYITYDFSIVVEYTVFRPFENIKSKNKGFTREELEQLLAEYEEEDQDN